MNCMMLVIYFTLPSTTSIIIKTFSCVTFYNSEGSTESFLLTDMVLRCEGQRYNTAYGYALAMVAVFPIGVPITGI